jgi:UDP-3-O-[3-hydroxymyristoyl] glucosamine N-acyltransferase
MKLAEIAARLDCELVGDGDTEIHGLAPIEDAAPGMLTFLANPRYRSHLATTRASAVILARSETPAAIATLLAADPYFAFARAIDLFYVPAPLADGIHPSAVIAASATIGPDARIGPHCVVGDKVVLGARACLDANVVLYPEVVVGDDFRAQANVVVRERVRIGSRVILQPGCVIGGDGFGYAPGPDGRIHKITQGGTVVLEDDVEIGANATIDRAAIGETRLGRGAKIDNLVQVAHGCTVGPGSMLAAQVGLSGSTRLGRFVRMGGQSATAGHLSIGDGATIAARSGITNDVAAGATMGGFPQQPLEAFRRTLASLPRLPEILRRLRRIEKQLGSDREP